MKRKCQLSLTKANNFEFYYYFVIKLLHNF
jgi:hypothetical protein